MQPDPAMWPWFIIPVDYMGVEWRKFNNDAYELVVVRKDKHPGIQSCFYVFPDLDEYGMRDLYQPHPTLPDHWTYVGRSDDIIVFSTGEKLNPVTIEGAVTGHADVFGAQVVGSKRFHAALLIEPVRHPNNEEEKQQFLDEIWPTIDKVNAETVAHGRIPRDFVYLSDPERPFPRAGKGTIQRALVDKLYENDLNQLFADSTGPPATVFDLDLSSRGAFSKSVRDLLQSVLKFRELGADADFFASGVDSLEVMQLSRVLTASLRKAGIQIDDGTVTLRDIYTHPTVAQLTLYAYSLVLGNGAQDGKPDASAVLGEEEDDADLCDALVEKYTHDLPSAVPNKPPPADDGQVIIITGTTGSLGAYFLHFSLASPSVSKVICFNRVADGPARQFEVSSSRGLSTDFSRVEFLQADLSKPDLGLGVAIYERLAGEVDRIVHNAWPVNFNMSVLSFEPHIRGVRHLVDFSAQACRKVVPITFISSVGSAQQWRGTSLLIPETSLPDWSIAVMGYGKSKLASSTILDRATKVSGVPSAIIRVGQVAGPRGARGKWNPQEWLPSLVRSSLYLGLLPDGLGTFGDLGWAPVEDIANAVLEISAVTSRLPVEQINGYFHVLNPKPTDWSSLVPALCDFYGTRIRAVIPLDEWVRALEHSQVATEDIDSNPGVKLLGTYKGVLEDANQGTRAKFATERAELYSRTMGQIMAVTPELLIHWCEQLQF
jgi:thioester reductase-like protein